MCMFLGNVTVQYYKQDHAMSSGTQPVSMIKLEVHGRARREAARRRKSECKINLSPR